MEGTLNNPLPGEDLHLVEIKRLALHGDGVGRIASGGDRQGKVAFVPYTLPDEIVAAGRTVGTDIYLVGVDALAECVQMVKDGTMTGTVLNDHIGQSHTAVDAAVKYIMGETVDTYLWVDYQKVA